MGLTRSSVGKGALGDLPRGERRGERRGVTVALAGNPNVGKSTVFNALTGLHQHTGNWPGKTVERAEGVFSSGGHEYTLVDIPGTYSLLANSKDEEAARDFIASGEADAVIVVCDATALLRNLNLVLQITELTPRVIVCVNLLDEAKSRGIRLDLPLLSSRLGLPVVGVTAKKKRTLSSLVSVLDRLTDGELLPSPPPIKYDEKTERLISETAEKYADTGENVPARWLAIRDITTGVSGDDKARDSIANRLLAVAEDACRDVVTLPEHGGDVRDRRLDRVLTGRITAFPVMLAFLALILWITVAGANYVSDALASFLFSAEAPLNSFFSYIHAPEFVRGALVDGVFRVLAWVVSVMLPPMAIFFPLFTLLEDVGYLPRIAYNLDRPLHRCGACGKQALTTCMGFGCNAAGVVGCRIIDSPRERLLAILTNGFVPCNGRFPTLTAIITMFFAASSLLSSLLLTAVVVGSVLFSLFVTYILSKTVLAGESSSFTLELPPYRKPKVGEILVRSVFDRTLFVLRRAVVAAAPAGLLIWLAANVTVGGESILSICSGFLDPFASAIGLDGVILLAFILGLPANEIVIPIIIMAYTASGTLTGYASLSELHGLLASNGWTPVTAVCMMVFCLMHSPCLTTLFTVKSETKSLRWTLAAALIPTATGIVVCFFINLIFGRLV